MQRLRSFVMSLHRASTSRLLDCHPEKPFYEAGGQSQVNDVVVHLLFSVLMYDETVGERSLIRDFPFENNQG